MSRAGLALKVQPTLNYSDSLANDGIFRVLLIWSAPFVLELTSGEMRVPMKAHTRLVVKDRDFALMRTGDRACDENCFNHSNELLRQIFNTHSYPGTASVGGMLQTHTYGLSLI